MWNTIDELSSAETTVKKFVFTKTDAIAESVLYQYPTYADRTVICCSTQSGCPIGCRFCGAGDAFVRSLTTDEIVSQPVTLLNHITETTGTAADAIHKLQIMFMSMGEPMLNMQRLIEAMTVLHDKYPHAALLVSTSGPDVNYQPFIDYSTVNPTVGLQFSVHESTDTARDLLIPFKKKLPLAQIAETGEQWAQATRRRPYFNYCVHDGNNTQDDVDRLAALLNPQLWEATISVICERDETLTAAHHRQRELTETFMTRMLTAGYSTRLFDPAGQSLGGGCGQLYYVQKWFADHPEFARRSAGTGLPVVHAPC